VGREAQFGESGKTKKLTKEQSRRADAGSLMFTGRACRGEYKECRKVAEREAAEGRNRRKEKSINPMKPGGTTIRMSTEITIKPTVIGLEPDSMDFRRRKARNKESGEPK